MTLNGAHWYEDIQLVVNVKPSHLKTIHSSEYQLMIGSGTLVMETP